MPVHSKFQSSDNKPKYFCYHFESFPENTATMYVVNDHCEMDGCTFEVILTSQELVLRV